MSGTTGQAQPSGLVWHWLREPQQDTRRLPLTRQLNLQIRLAMSRDNVRGPQVLARVIRVTRWSSRWLSVKEGPLCDLCSTFTPFKFEEGAERL